MLMPDLLGQPQFRQGLLGHALAVSLMHPSRVTRLGLSEAEETSISMRGKYYKRRGIINLRLMRAACMQVLNLDFCTLSALPPVLGQLTALTTLDVEGNLYLGDRVRGASSPAGAGMGLLGQGGGAAAAQPPPPPFPLDLAGLQNLRFLNLNSCGLTAIPGVRSASLCGPPGIGCLV